MIGGRLTQGAFGQRAIVAIGAALALATSAEANAPEADAQALLAPVRSFQRAFNAGDMRYPTDVFAPGAVMVDGFAPYVWTGPRAAQTWYAAVLGATPAANKAFREQRYKLELGKPELIRSEGSLAYLVVPGIDRWTADGKAHFERAHWAITLRRTPGGWRILSHSWAIVEAG